MKETGINFYDDENKAYFSSNEEKQINRVMRLGEANPGTVDIYKLPKDNFGVLYCAIPKAWVFIRVPKKMNLTEEQKQERADRMRGIRSVTDDSTVLEEEG